ACVIRGRSGAMSMPGCPASSTDETGCPSYETAVVSGSATAGLANAGPCALRSAQKTVLRRRKRHAAQRALGFPIRQPFRDARLFPPKRKDYKNLDIELAGPCCLSIPLCSV